MNQLRFFLPFILLLLSLPLLGATLHTLLHHHPSLWAIVLTQGMSILGCFTLLGLGLGIPLIVLASVLGWIQVVLLLTGSIPPHLGKAGLMKVLSTLFSKI